METKVMYEAPLSWEIFIRPELYFTASAVTDFDKNPIYEEEFE